MVNMVREQFLKLLKSDLQKSIFSGYALFFLNNVVALFLTPYMLKFVTKEEYGLYILCVDFLAWVGFLEFGTSKVVESKTGHLIAKDDTLGINKMFNSSFFFQLTIGLLIIPIFYISVKLGIGNNKIQHLNLIILIFSISAGLSVLKNLFSALIIASRKVYLDNSIQFFINILNYVLVLALTPFIGGLGLALISLFIVVLILIRSRYRIKKLYPFLSNSFRYFDKYELNSIFSNGLYFSLGSIATVLISKIDSFVLGKYIGLESVTSYYITIKLFILTQKLIQILYNNYRPYLSIFFGNENFEGLRMFYNTTSWFLYGITTLFIGIAMYINQYFVIFWVGEDYLMNSQFSILFGLYIMLDLFTLPSRIVLTSSLFKIRNQSFARFFEGILRILLIYLMFSNLKEDIMPLASVISVLIFGNIFFYYQIKLYFKEKLDKQPSNFVYIALVNFGLVMFSLYINMNSFIPLVLLLVAIAILTYCFRYEFKNLRLLKIQLLNVSNLK
jgi:O-antigen/teichoic acid export membrane protein